jgi:hypothetical protein
MIPTKKQLETLNEAIIDHFGSIEEAKALANKRYKMTNDRFKVWSNLPTRQKQRTIPPCFVDTLIDCGEFSIYYAEGKGPLTARNGAGYYIAVDTGMTRLDYKFA